MMTCLAVSTEYRRVTDGQTDILPWHSPRYAYASHGKNCPMNEMKPAVKFLIYSYEICN